MTKRDELVKIISNHLNQITIDETEVLGSFMESLDNFREEQKKALDDAKKEESKRRVKRNKRYNHDNDDMITDPVDTLSKYEDGDFEETRERERSYCICGKGSYGNMIKCDNPDCPIGWYHYSCVGLPPNYVIAENETWYCPKCREHMKK